MPLLLEDTIERTLFCHNHIHSSATSKMQAINNSIIAVVIIKGYQPWSIKKAIPNNSIPVVVVYTIAYKNTETRTRTSLDSMLVLLA